MKKLLLSFLIGIVFIFSFAPLSQIKAQTTWYNQSFPEWYVKVYDTKNPNEIFGERYTAAQVQWIVYSLPSLLINFVADGNTDLASCLLMGQQVVDTETCGKSISTAFDNLFSKFKIKEVAESQSTASSVKSQILAERPLSGISYVRGLVNKLNPVTSVSAQVDTSRGFGGSALYSIVFLWKATRNVAFFLFVLVTIVFAFMIMFRVKLSPQVVITVQSALPKIITTLILVTFSYAIAGFMVDLIYVIMALFATLVAGPMSDPNGMGTFATSAVLKFVDGSVFNNIFGGGALTLLVYFVIYIILYVIAAALAIISSTLSFDLSSIIMSVLLLIFVVAIILICIWYIIKVTFVLFKTLAEVYAMVIIGPLQITLGALFPQAGFGAWLKKLFSKLMVFPLTGVFIFLAYVLLIDSMRLSLYGIIHNSIAVDAWNLVLGNLSSTAQIVGLSGNFADNLQVGGLWGPPMLGNAGGATPIAFMLMSVGLLMMIPKISESIDSFLAGKGFAGTGIGEAMGPFGSLGKAVGGAAMGGATTYGATRGGEALTNYYNNLVDKGKEQTFQGKAVSELIKVLNSMKKP